MLGTFSEQALSDYAEKVRTKTKTVAAGQGTEWADNAGLGENDSSFVDENESQDPDDYKGKVGKVKKALKQQVLNHSEAEDWDSYDFTVCVRNDGSVYGTRGKCRLGKETSEDQAALLRASNRKRGKGTLGGSLKQRLAKDPEATHLAKKLQDVATELKKAKKTLGAAAANLEKNKGQEEARLKYRKAQSAVNDVFTRHEQARYELGKRVRELTTEQKTQNQGPRKKVSAAPATDPLRQKTGVFNRSDWD